MKKSCRTCAKFGYVWYDKKQQWPSCWPDGQDGDYCVDVWEEELDIDRSVPSMDCSWEEKK